MKNKIKPIPKYLIFSAYWWNPFFWVLIFTLPILFSIFYFFLYFLAISREVIKDLKKWDLN